MMEGPFGPQWLWDSFGPTYPCIPRERIGDVLDGGKWCGASSGFGIGLGARRGRVGLRLGLGLG